MPPNSFQQGNLLGGFFHLIKVNLVVDKLSLSTIDWGIGFAILKPTIIVGFYA
jgi:hypothetical protein